ncbi:MAG: glycosyltransferase family 4 protein [Bacillota bacterium]
MKIAIIADRLELGGVESHIISLVNGFLRRGHRVLLNVAASAPDLLAQIDQTNPEFVYVPWSDNPVWDVKNFAPDIIQAHPFTAIVRGHQMAIALKKPLFITIHGLYDFGIDRSPLGYSIGERVQAIIAVDQGVAAVLAQNASFPEKVLIVHNGIDLNIFQPLPLNIDQRFSLGLNPKWFTMAIISRLGDGKEVPIFQLVRLAPKWGFLLRGLNMIIVGDGPGFGQLQDEIRSIHSPGYHYQVLAVGRQLNIKRYLAVADIVAACDRAALEAMACQRPVLAVNANGFAGVITKNNYETILFKRSGYRPAAEDELTEIISTIAMKKRYRAKIGLNGCSIVHRYFNLEDTLDQLERLFATALSK